MLISSPYGFISYNSHDFLLSTLSSLVDEGIYDRACAWFHSPVRDEKPHFHTYVEPSKQVDPMSLVDRFIEVGEDGCPQSIAVRRQCRSKFRDAYLYGIHDRDYLSYKGLKREAVNIVSRDHIYLGDFSADIDEAEVYCLRTCMAPFVRLKKLVRDGYSLEGVYRELRIPYSQFNSVAHAYHEIERSLGRSYRLSEYQPSLILQESLDFASLTAQESEKK